MLPIVLGKGNQQTNDRHDDGIEVLKYRNEGLGLESFNDNDDNTVGNGEVVHRDQGKKNSMKVSA